MKRLLISIFPFFWLYFNPAFGQVASSKPTDTQNPFMQYAESLQNCSQGTFTLPIPLGGTITYTIQGLESNLCQVTIARTVAGRNILMRCSYKINELPILVKNITDTASGKKVSSDAADDISRSACKLAQ